MKTGMVTVFGGSGFIGRHLTRELIDAGATVRVAVRHPDRAEPMPLRLRGRFQAVEADVLDEQSVSAAVVGAHAVINLVGILTEAGVRQTYRAVHLDGAGRVALAARRVGVQRLIHFSALGARRDAPAASDRTKAEGEEAVRAAFPTATIIRPSLVYGSDDHFFNSFAALAKRSPVLPLIGGGRTRFQPVHVADLSHAVVRALLHLPETAGSTYELGGPRIYTFKELLALLVHVLGRRRMFLSIPFPLAELLARLFELLPNPPLTRDQVRLLKTDKVVGGAEPTLADLGITPSAVETFLHPALIGGAKAHRSAER